MSYNPNPYPYKGQSVQPPIPKPDDSGKWTWRDWLAKVFIPILAALIGAGVIFGVHSATTSSGPTIPILNSAYAGTMTRTNDGATFALKMDQLNENQNTGAFTSSATINGCPTTVTGKVTASGSLTFTAQESNACQDGGLVGDFTGNVAASGSLGGSWTVRNQPIGGTWDVQ
jgi:hypothetical protein